MSTKTINSAERANLDEAALAMQQAYAITRIIGGRFACKKCPYKIDHDDIHSALSAVEDFLARAMDVLQKEPRGKSETASELAP